MKSIIFALIATIALCTSAQGKNRTVTENDSLGNKKRVIELSENIVNGTTVTDTLSIMTYNESSAANNNEYPNERNDNSDFDFGWDMGSNLKHVAIAITGIVFVFGFPIVITFIIFFFRYKNRKAKYRLMEQALASGQPLPDNLFKETVDVTDTRSKGIKNAFLGIGLFIFLWSVTGEFGLGCIGLLIMFTGLGQIVIHYTQQNKDRKASNTDNEEK